MRIVLLTGSAVLYIFIGFLTAYVLYRKTDLDFKATTNILLWPFVLIAILIAVVIYYLNKFADFVSRKIERLFKRIDRRKQRNGLN